jgi:predicted NAD/FAD-binding protein
MSFSASIDGGEYEYNGSFYGLFGQKLNLMNVQHWLIVWEILRFFREASGYLKGTSHNLSLGELLKSQKFSSTFVHRHLLPIAAAIWSSSTKDMSEYPAAAFIRLFQIMDCYKPHSVRNGAQCVVDRVNM